jgi:hypothetical protein
MTHESFSVLRRTCKNWEGIASVLNQQNLSRLTSRADFFALASTTRGCSIMGVTWVLTALTVLTSVFFAPAAEVGRSEPPAVIGFVRGTPSLG